MRIPFRCLEIKSEKRSRSEMERIGVDPAGIRIMTPKQFHYNLKIEGLTPAQANIIKQDMLSIGGEAAVAKGAASCSVDSSGAILSGTLKQFNILTEKLMRQSLGLSRAAGAIDDVIANIRKEDFIFKSRTREWSLGKRTIIMGILNVTPDSFSDGGKFFDKGMAIERAFEMIEEGADWIDIGGESTRPGAKPVTATDEIKRVVPVIEALATKGATVSVDTTKVDVAKAAIEAGAEIVNDVSALTMDKDMAAVCASMGAPVILMHMRGTPATMQLDTAYKDLIGEVYDYLAERVEAAVSAGIGRDKIIIDPGIGFGKSGEGNLELIKNLAEFRSMGLPILIGASRKSFIGKTIGAAMEDRVTGTLAAHTVALMNGANILRVHDVRQARKAADMTDAIRMSGI